MASVHSPAADVQGQGHIIPIPPIVTAQDWITYYGAALSPTDPEVVILYKAVRDDYHSAYGFLYAFGTMPQAPDWDGGRDECGGGLHFCSTPSAAHDFDNQATRFMACPIRVADIVIHQSPSYPTKIKAPGVCAPIWEVDRFGNPLVLDTSVTTC